ncbi:ALP1-like protein [Tanacetum coccineum]
MSLGIGAVGFRITICEPFPLCLLDHDHMQAYSLMDISAAEYFNMKHSKARNVIERCFGLLKGHWKILASPSFFPIATQVRIILACCLLHNLIRKYMRVDPQELVQNEEDEIDGEQLVEEACLSHISPTDEWYNFRDGLAHQMFNEWRDESNPIPDAH